MFRRSDHAAALYLLAVTAGAQPAEPARIGHPDVTVTRHFAMTPGGQLHYRMAAPVDGAAAVRRPVLALHQSPNSSQVFVEFIGELARDRLVVAADTPGFGDSDKPREPPEIADYAEAMHALLDELGWREVDLVGYHTGASIATALAERDGDRIHALLLVGVALFNDAEADAFFERPWPPPGDFDADFVAREWQRSKRWQGPGQSDDSVRRTYLAKLGAGRNAWWGARAVFRDRERLAARLGRLRQPLLIVSPRDDLWDITPRAAALRPDARFETLPDHGFGVFEVIPDVFATLAREHFDR
ncbi:MAG: alpha/beta fold hydrolase [Pseudomonadota bacterium]